MFRDEISRTPMTSDIANSIFDTITGESYNGDVTFLATLRALVYPRMSEGERIHLSFTQAAYTAEEIASNKAERVVKAIIDMEYIGPGRIVVVNFNARKPEDNQAALDLMKSTFCNVYKDFTRIEKVTDFFRKTFGVQCFVNTEQKQVILFAESLNLRKLHYLQCGIFAFLPWYFDPGVPVEPNEMALVKSLLEKDSSKYHECLRMLSEKFDFRSEQIRKQLAGFEVRFEKNELERLVRSMNETRRNINRLQEDISNQLMRLRDAQSRHLGLELKIAEGSEGDSEIMEYFLRNKKLVLSDVTGEIMDFAVKDYITYFDEVQAKKVIDNERSYIYECSEGIFSKEDVKRLMYEIFIEQTLKIRVCAGYSFNLRNQRVDAIQGYNFDEHEFDKYIPNSHINSYRCLGDYQREINKSLNESDYISAIEQCVASCKSLNFGDGIVMSDFMSNLYGRNRYSKNHCIELPDGNVVTPKEAIEWLKAQYEPAAEEVSSDEVEIVDGAAVSAEEEADE